MVIAQSAITVGESSTSEASSIQLDDLAQLDFDNVLQHVEFLSGLDSRIVGYEGFYAAADYIKAYWSSLGLAVHEESFSITTPIVERSSIRAEMPDGSKVDVEAYPLWPNHVNPSPYTSPEEGDRLIYVSRGLPEDFNGIDPEDSFVVMDFNNRWYWKNAATFGAKGIVFIEPEDTSGIQAIQKMFSIPINFPRLYVKGEAASMLKKLVVENGEARIWVDSSMVWKEKEVANLVAIVEGTDPDLSDEVAIIGAYYDSWSVVPQISPGATDSMGVAVLLELSRLLGSSPPKRTIWLVAFAGHYQGLVGAREFVETHFAELGSKFKMMLSLDLASDSDFLAVYASGSMYGYNYPATLTSRYEKWIGRIFTNWLPSLQQELNEEIHLIDGVLWSYPTWIRGSPQFEPFLRYLEAEVFTEACYGGGLGFVTTNAFRVYQYTPVDTYDRIQPDNLRKQATFLWPILYNSANMVVDYFLAPMRLANDWGLITVTLQLALYNRTSDWFGQFAHKDAIFFVSVGGVMYSAGTTVAAGFTPASSVGPSRSVVVQGTPVGLFAAPPIASPGQAAQAGLLGAPLGFTFVIKPDADGKVVLKGIKPYTGIDAHCYVLDPRTGVITAATDTGPFGTGKVKYGGLFGQQSAQAAPTITPTGAGLGYLAQSGEAARAFSVYTPQGFRYVPVFNASSIAILGLFDPSRAEDPLALRIEVYNFISHSYFVWRDTLAPWPEAMVFVEPDIPSEILVRSQAGILAVLNNASGNHPEGEGYRIGFGETATLTLFDASKDMFYLAHARAGFLMAKMSANPKLVLYLESMYKFRQLSEEALQNGDRGKLYSYSVAYWQYALNAYQSSFSLIYDTVNTATFFFFLSAAFTILLGRLLGRREGGLRRMIIIVVLFLVTNIALGTVHPGYTISSNIWMLVDGLSVVLFSFLLFYVVVDEFNSAVKSISRTILGSHSSDIERGSLVFSAISMGIENLKKRPIRTGLALSTIIITVSAMTLFTTMGVMVYSYSTSLGASSYTGMLVKRPLPDALYAPISELYLLAVGDMASEEVLEIQVNPRAWVYPPGQKMLVTWRPENSTIRGILAMTTEEAQVLEAALMPGGVTFMPNVTNVCLIGEAVANALSSDLGIEIKPGTQLRLYGIPVTVIGILDDEMGYALMSRDLDQGALTPPDPTATAISRTPSYLDFSNLVFIPYEFARSYFNVQPNAISAYVTSPTLKEEDLWERSFGIALTLHFDVFYGIEEEGTAKRAGARDIYSMGGGENIAVPMLLSSLTLLSMMLSAVYERTKEIATLSTVGLSPRHIGSIFIMESVTLAFVGSFLGYLIGASFTSVLWGLNLYPEGLLPNVSSGVVIIVMGVMMSATMLSSVYPMIKASKLATPSLIRKWRIGSRPVGDYWSVSFPFNATSEEAIGVLTFLREFLEASTTERTGLFMLLKPIELTEEEQQKVLSTRLQLSPFDAGIIQDIEIVSRMMAPDRYGFEFIIRRVLGVENLWITSNRALLNELRKQFLLWRVLVPDEKNRYIQEGNK